MEREHLKRRLTTVLIADVVGYCRLMGDDEEGTHVRLADHIKDLMEPKIAENRGRLIRTAGDGFLIGFDSAIDAVRCGLDIQRELADHNLAVTTKRRIQLRIGINTGDVIVDERDIYGNSVNIAARLEGLAEPGEIYVTRTVRDQLQGYPDLSFEDRGARRVKNIKTPIRVFRVKRVQRQPPKALSQSVIARAGRLFSTQVWLHWRSAVVTIVMLAVTAAVTVAALPIR